MDVFADIVTGKTSLAEVMFLVAMILSLIAAVIAFQVKTLWATLVALAIGFTAFGFFLL
jgi:hypothetical protein